MEQKKNLLGLTIDEIKDVLADIGQEKYRAKQIFQWVNKGVKDISQMTNLSKALRDELDKIAYISKLSIRHKLVSKLDGTTKYLFELEDGNIIESVLMKYKHGLTVCISSQVGCRMGCKFCASTGAGFMRDLSAGEILDQVLTIQADNEDRVGNVVIMGIGEPFENYDNVVKFMRIVNMPDSLNIGFRHITVSTCGLVPEMLRLSKESMPVNLSISLHAPNDQIREKLMPINRRYSIDKLIEACKIYTETTKRRITFEYAMIAGVNDSEDNARELAHRIKGMLCHANLIPVNNIEGAEFIRSNRDKMEKFKSILERFGIETTIRRELGTDISAACGQLRRNNVKS